MTNYFARSMSDGSKYLPFDPEGIPEDLTAHPHWLVCDHKGQPLDFKSNTTPHHWMSYEDALKIVQTRPSKHGLWPYIVLTDGSGITCFDVDFKPRKGTETPEKYEERVARAWRALERLREMLPNRYEERSKSGEGFHIFIGGSFKGKGGDGRGDWTEVEVYTRQRGIAMTGRVEGGNSDLWTYEDKEVQEYRDMIKGPTIERSPADRKDGSVPVEHAREVLNKLAKKIGRPKRPDWLKIASAVCDGVGEDEGINLMREFFPEEESGECERLVRSLKFFASWDTLRYYGVETDDRETLLEGFSNLDDEPGAVKFPSIIRGIQSFPTDPPAEDILLGDGWLRRGDIGFLTSSAGAGKSVWVIQAAIGWALGKRYCGITPTRPLRILHFLGEDDESTFGLCREGLLEHAEECMGFSPSPEDLGNLDCRIRTDLSRHRAGTPFLSYLDALLTEEAADLVIINPLLAYVGGEIVSEGPTFLRNGLMPLLQKHKCAALIAHHTCKLSRESWKTIDPIYAAIGGGEMANIPRTSLVLMPTSEEGLHRVVVTKRQTTGWKDEEGEFKTEFFVRRSSSPVRPAWLPVSHSEAIEKVRDGKGACRKAKATFADVAAVLGDGPLPQSEVMGAIMRQTNCSETTAKRVIREARALGRIEARSKPNLRGGKDIQLLNLSDESTQDWDGLEDFPNEP